MSSFENSLTPDNFENKSSTFIDLLIVHLKSAQIHTVPSCFNTGTIGLAQSENCIFVMIFSSSILLISVLILSLMSTALIRLS
jgi:hypothetical protein